ncbi:hypothetical protein PTI45_04633 [Paenibacillus nuruki]|uniref:Uncharacterized protein n=1 Tax=Paenibacillus nuruki TaxID=1886670 RepID=A0A1E3KX35_9BACL|nr:hypothetical protein [Paenibacillus nuruki]ODP26024.1 hypothetical protein PTI45_04633 [Paenibacillus nuruki]
MSINQSHEKNNALLIEKIKSTLMQKSHSFCLRSNEILRFEVRNEGQVIQYINDAEDNELTKVFALSAESLSTFFEIIELQFNEIDTILQANVEVELTIILSGSNNVGSAKLTVNEQIPHS